MADEDLGNVIDDSFEEHKRKVAIDVLGERAYLTIGLIAELLNHPKHGAVIKQITLQELLDAASGGASDEEEPDEGADEVAAAPAPTKTKGAGKAKKKAAKKKAKAAPTTKKTTKKAKAAPTTKKKAKAKKGKKADSGKTKPRLDRDFGYAEIKKALKAAKEPVGMGHLVEVTGFPTVQTRTFLKELEKQSEVKRHGKGKATKYSLK